MKFQITDGLDLLAIGFCDLGNYLRYKKPLSAVWFDREGSVAKYLCIMPYDPEYRAAIRQNIVENLYVDYTDRLEDLHQLLSPLLRLFPNGDYELKYYKAEEGEFFRMSTVEFAPNEFYTFHQPCYPTIAESTNLKDIEKKIAKYEDEVKNWKYRGETPASIIEWSTDFIHEPNYIPLIATQPLSSIDEGRIWYFQNEIKQGKHPFIIVFNSFLAEYGWYNDSYSDHFVLDGHHKLYAYQSLGKFPPVVEITHLPKSIADLEFDLELLSEVLFPWQFEHIKQHY